jgi:hypothetical protein
MPTLAHSVANQSDFSGASYGRHFLCVRPFLDLLGDLLRSALAVAHLTREEDSEQPGTAKFVTAAPVLVVT